MPDPELERAQRAVGRRLAEERRRLGLTQEALAEKLGVSAKYLQRIEAGRQNLTLGSLVTLARALGKKPLDLLRPPRKLDRPPPGRPRRT